MKVMCRLSRKPGACADPRCMGATQVVISSGNEISSITRAAIAGLNGFWPRPPYTCLPMTTANRLPSAAIHHGAKGGSDIASNHAVRMPEPSISAGRTARPCRCTVTASPTMADISATAHKLIAGQPNSQNRTTWRESGEQYRAHHLAYADRCVRVRGMCDLVHVKSPAQLEQICRSR